MKDLAPIAPGPFVGTLDSLKANRYPKWFTDGKLGIWAHWGPQAVPMRGDWYARRMYQPGDKDYQDNLEHRGHPSKSGYKDIIPLWKAEKWDPERLMALYKKAGAKYFVSMGAHHDNFDLWDSNYQRWNAVRMGPHRNVVGDWQKAARKYGLRFGVSEHLGASWTWFQAAHGSDAGGAYDGNAPTLEDLYHPKALPGDTGWYTTDPRWHKEWYRRVKDLIDQHHPDLLYTDGPLPFGEVGASIVAHLYNVNRESVYAVKQPGEGRWAQDVERGVLAGIQEFPWQTDTSIGDWYYDRDWKYRDAAWVLHTLIDVVSKNGNLLINVVQLPDGSLDPEAETILAEMAAWMGPNGESIYGTRPWLVFGEGPTRARGGAFKEDFAFNAKDVRYAAKGDGAVYATFMGPVELRQQTLRALAKAPGDGAEVTDVRLLGSKESVEWSQGSDGLHLTLPTARFSKIATVVKITGRNLRDFREMPTDLMGAASAMIEPDAKGDLRLPAELAETHGPGIDVETRDGQENVGFWDSPEAWASWTVDLKPGTYEAFASVASLAPTTLEIAVGDQARRVAITPTGDWARFAELPAGRFEIPAGGKSTVHARPADKPNWKAINLRRLVFRRVS